MLKLARASDGNHAFAADAAALIPIFNREFNDVLASCAQMVSVDVDLQPGVKVVRALSRDGTIDGQHAKFRLNQIYQATEHYLLLEVEIDKSVASGEQELGRVNIAYTSPQDGSRHEMKTGIRGSFSASETAVSESRDHTVHAAVVEQTTRERALKAIALRDQGKFKEAQGLLRQNVEDIKGYSQAAGRSSPQLERLAKEYDSIANTAAAAAPAAWGMQRKVLQEMQAAPAGSSVRY
jgi:Ca-activated chloride channel family protein